MEHNQPYIYIDNTNTTVKEMQPYVTLAEFHGYTIHYLIVENRHNGGSSHYVPIETYNKMFSRFDIQLLPSGITKKVKSIKPIKTFYKYIKKYWT